MWESFVRTSMASIQCRDCSLRSVLAYLFKRPIRPVREVNAPLAGVRRHRHLSGRRHFPLGGQVLKCDSMTMFITLFIPGSLSYHHYYYNNHLARSGLLPVRFVNMWIERAHRFNHSSMRFLAEQLTEFFPSHKIYNFKCDIIFSICTDDHENVS